MQLWREIARCLEDNARYDDHENPRVDPERVRSGLVRLLSHQAALSGRKEEVAFDDEQMLEFYARSLADATRQGCPA